MIDEYSKSSLIPIKNPEKMQEIYNKAIMKPRILNLTKSIVLVFLTFTFPNLDRTKTSDRC